MRFLDKLPLLYIGLAALTLGLAPFVPEPHVVEKLRILVQGALVKPVDMADLAMHGLTWLLVLAKLARMAATR